MAKVGQSMASCRRSEALSRNYLKVEKPIVIQFTGGHGGGGLGKRNRRGVSNNNLSREDTREFQESFLRLWLGDSMKELTIASHHSVPFEEFEAAVKEYFNAYDAGKDFIDKKMAKVTRQIKTGERDVKAGKPKAALKALKGAAKKNVKLTKEDRDVRDPLIERCKKGMGRKGKK